MLRFSKSSTIDLRRRRIFFGAVPEWVKKHYSLMLKNERLGIYLKSDKRFPRPGRDGYFDRVKAVLSYMSFAGGDGVTPPMACEKWNYGSTTTTSPLLAATSSTGGAAPAQLTYWDGHGNGEIIRLMMAVCGEKWEDKVALDDTGATHISNAAQFNKLREAGVLMSDQLPLLQIDGLNLVQKMAAVRYLSRKHGLYGKDNAEATKCDIIQEALLDYGGQKENDYKVLPRLGRALGAGPFFLGENMSFVDVTFFKIIDDRTAAEADCLGTMPNWVKAHYSLMQKNEKMSTYLKSDKRFPRPGRDGYFDRVKAVLGYLSFAGGDGVQPPIACEQWNYKSTL